MPLTTLNFRPGINKEETDYSNENGWVDGNLIRFRKGRPEKIGGWEKQSDSNTYLGSGRALHSWISLGGARYLGIGTHLKYYIEEGEAYNDITPIRLTTSAGDVTFSATNGSSTLTVTDASHGAATGDFVTFSGAASLGGNVTATVINQEYQILLVTGTNTYTVTAKDTSGAEVTANSSDSGNGGSSVVGNYQINTGLDIGVSGAGWGAGTWGRGTWGAASSDAIVTNTLRLWSHDNFGEDLIMNVRDGGIYYWDETNTLSTRGVDITTLAGSDSAPTVAKQILVSDRDRHIIAFGCDTEANPGVQDPLAIRFSSQES